MKEKLAEICKQKLKEEKNTFFNLRGELENLQKDHEQKAKHQSEEKVANMVQNTLKK